MSSSMVCAPRASAADVVVDGEPWRGPLQYRHLGADQLGHLRHPRCVEPCDHMAVVDEQRRTLVAQARARGAVHAHQAVGADLAGRYAQPSAQISHQGHAAQHAVGDVVAEQHAVAAHRPGVKKAVEAGHTFHVGQGQLQFAGDYTEQVPRQPAHLLLRLTQDLNQRMRVAPVAGEHLVQGLVLEAHSDFIACRLAMTIPVRWPTQVGSITPIKEGVASSERVGDRNEIPNVSRSSRHTS
jgi:hypothetical protein